MDWLPLIIAAVIGIIIGAIVTVIPYRRRGEEFQYRVRDLESKIKKTDTDLNDARGQGQALTASLRTTEANLTDANGQIALLTDGKNALDVSLADAKSTLAALTEEKNALTANLDEATTKIASLNDEKAALEVALTGMTAQAATMRKDFDLKVTEYDTKVASLTSNLDGAGAEITTLKSNVDASAQALTAKEAELADAHTSLQGIKHEMDTLTTLKGDLETKLSRARADVAAELALLTSTMIKMKEQALGEANAKITTLTSELDALKSDSHNN